ncbi:MAG TPA: right-handed parallel beta-helix repeat-containing protein [Gaiellaceae bacterium]
MPPPGTSCAKPGYNTIQAAVNAASPGDTITICPATYAEQVSVTTSGITLAGKPGATVVPPAPGFLGPLVAVGTLADNGADVTGVVVKGLKVDGQNSAGTPGGTRLIASPAGIRYENASGAIRSNQVLNVNDPACFGCQSGVAILAHTNAGHTANVIVSGNTVSGFQKGGIVADAGAAGSDFTAGAGLTGTVSKNQVTGAGVINNQAQNGIQVSRGAKASVVGNTVSDVIYANPSDADTTSAAILLYDAGNGVLVNANTVSRFDIGIDNESDNGSGQNAVISGNVVNGNRNAPSDNPSGCGTVLKGIDSNDAAVTISGNSVTNVQLDPALLGCQTGVGIRSGIFSDDGVASPLLSVIRNNSVSDIQKGGIVVNGDMNVGRVQGNTVTGWGNSSALAQNLIQFGFGATGSIGGSTAPKGNHLDNFGGYTGNGSLAHDSAAGILLYKAGGLVGIHQNVFRATPGIVNPGTGTIPGGYAVVLETDDPFAGVGTPDANALKNDWGVYTSAEISSLIWDYNDDPGDQLGVVSFVPFLGP